MRHALHSMGIAVLSTAVGIGLRLAPVGTVWALLDGAAGLLARIHPRDPAPGATAERLAREIDAVLEKRIPGVRGRCLKRSLILYAMLRRRGIHPGWCVGHRLTPQGLVGHAWCTLDGAPVAEPAGATDAFRELIVRGAA